MYYVPQKKYYINGVAGINNCYYPNFLRLEYKIIPKYMFNRKNALLYMCVRRTIFAIDNGVK